MIDDRDIYPDDIDVIPHQDLTHEDWVRFHHMMESDKKDRMREDLESIGLDWDQLIGLSSDYDWLITECTHPEVIGFIKRWGYEDIDAVEDRDYDEDEYEEDEYDPNTEGGIESENGGDAGEIELEWDST